MAQCQRCGGEIGSVDGDCPKCRKALSEEAEGRYVSEGAAESAGEESAANPRPSRARLGAVGAAAGAIYGALVIAAYVMLDRLFFGGTESAGMDLGGAALLGVIGGGLLGAVIGGLTMVTGSTGVGVVTGAVVLGLLKGAGTSMLGLGSGVTAANFVVGGCYGAIVGLVVSGSVARSVRSG
jgi:hypothetical protein